MIARKTGMGARYGPVQEKSGAVSIDRDFRMLPDRADDDLR
jgi:hypothetical protein